MQILFLSGLAFVIGLERTFRFFFQYHKIKGTSAFFGGILVVLLGYPLIGMIIEAYGFIVLFSGFFPVAVNFLRRIPIIGSILNLPGISSVIFLFYSIFLYFFLKDNVLCRQYFTYLEWMWPLIIKIVKIYIFFYWNTLLTVFSVFGSVSWRSVQNNDLMGRKMRTRPSSQWWLHKDSLLWYVFLKNQ